MTGCHAAFVLCGLTWSNQCCFKKSLFISLLSIFPFAAWTRALEKQVTLGTALEFLTPRSPTDLLPTPSSTSWARGCRGTDSRGTPRGRGTSKARGPRGRKHPYPSLQNAASSSLARKLYGGIASKTPNCIQQSTEIPASCFSFHSVVLLRDLHGAKEALCSWVSLRQIWLMKTGPIAKTFFPQFRQKS